ncbi:MAG: PQQ-dependent sugar dehydrogenase [Hyphomicrobiales bacterium]
MPYSRSPLGKGLAFVRTRAFFVAAAAAAALALCAAPHPANAFSLVPLGTFASPVDIRVAPGQPSLLYIVEKPGRIVILHDEVRLATPFLDIAGRVLDGGEQGLLSVAFPPDYATSRRFYVLFVNKAGNVEIDEFLRSAANERVAVRSSRRIVLEIPHPDAANHNGGQLHFGSGGLLYISIGDGGHTATPGDPARRLNSLLGKILRIDPRPGGGKAYRIPPANPFVGVAGRDEIYAYGLRNPWRFSLAGTVMAIGDVGESKQEEVNIRTVASARGSNFGWPQWEGKLLHDADKPGPHPPKFPIFIYNHDSGGCAIIGGYIVKDVQLPTLNGRYMYGDLCTGDIRSFAFNVAAQTATGDASLGVTVPGLTTFGQGTAGQVYLAGGSTVYRLEP